MKLNYNFTCIINYRHNIERLNNLRRTLEWINSFSGAEVIVVEQDKHSKLKDIKLQCRHIFIKSNMPFNRSWGFNVGSKYANSNILVLTDCDLIMNPNMFIDAIKQIENYEVVSPYTSVVDLTPQETNMNIGTIIEIDRPGRGETDNQKINICGGMTIFRKNAYQKIGGYHEDFIGWGGEDDFQTIKVKNFLTWIEVPGRCFHFYHERSAPDMNLYQKNLNLLQKLSAMNKEELQKVINNVATKSGMKNKYDNF
jgi:predicted glycosyltransferase involved in capsule biosynthesis